MRDPCMVLFGGSIVSLGRLEPPWPAEPAQVKAAEYTGAFLRILLFLLGLIIVLARLVLH